MSDNDLNITRGRETAERGVRDDVSSDPLTRRVDTVRREGRGGLVKSRDYLFKYDRTEGLGKPRIPGGVTTADRTDPRSAASLLHVIHSAYGVDRSMEDFLVSFDKWFFICHGLNGASQFMPAERATFNVNGDVFQFETAMTILGVGMRRFFRTFANEVVTAMRELYDSPNWDDPMEIDLRQQMISLSIKKGCPRYPWLAADSTEAATNLSQNELAAAMTAKGLTVAATSNAVDKRNMAVPVRSLDNYDSSVGASVGRDVDIHGGDPQYYK